MKKTLIALVALASMAVGAPATLTLENALLHTQNGDSMNLDAEGMQDSKNFTLTMSLNGTAFAESIYLVGQNLSNKHIVQLETNMFRNNVNTSYTLGTSIVYGSATSTSSSYKKAGIFATYGGFSTKSYGWQDGNNSDVEFFSDILSDWGYSYNSETSTSTSNITGVAYTLTGTVGSDFSSYLVVTLADGTTYNYSGTSSGYSFSDLTDINSISFDSDIVKEAYVFDTVSTATAANALNKAILVPEPATATLSLLALAGLAARRRRK